MCSDNDLIAAVDFILSKSLTRSQWHDVEMHGIEKYPANAKDVYDENCSVCHSKGNAGVPKIGDKKAWQPLIAQNMDVLIEHTINGAQHVKDGVCAHCSTGEIIAAIKYLVEQSKTTGNFTLW